MKPLITRTALALFMSLLLGATTAEQPLVINWSGKDVTGADVKVPVDRPSIVAFVRADQEQSKQAIKQLQATAGDTRAAQVVVILSGPLAADQAKTLWEQLPRTWSVVVDADFAASGKMAIHVWPTTLVIKASGAQVAHLAGMPKTFATDLAAYLDFVAGKIDDATLQKRLTTQDVITDSPAQAASRHLQVAQRLLEQSQVEQAKTELTAGLKYVPNDPMLQLTLARVYVLLSQPKDAIDILDKLPAGATPAWQASLVRAKALIALEKWADAKAILPEALKLNPDPAEAHYLLGLCYQHDQDWPHAAEQFRLAVEKSAAGQRMTIR
jgi:tetratricopeptide (TPR) repeat protein